MKCPRCGAQNNTPEKTLDHCINCNYLLTGEVEAPTMDLHRLARRSIVQGTVATVVLLGVFVGIAWSQDWFGLLGPTSFAPSPKPETTTIVGVPGVVVERDGTSYDLARDVTFAVSAIVLGVRTYEDDFARIAPHDLALGWGSTATTDRRRIETALDNRTMVLSSSDAAVNIRELSATAGIVRPIAANDAISRQLERLTAGDRLSIEGYVVTVRSNGATVNTPTAANALAYVVYVTSLTVNGKTTAVP